MTTRLFSTAQDFAQQLRGVCEKRRHLAFDDDARVGDILADVRRRGDEALIEYTRKFDGVDISAKTLRLDRDVIKSAAQRCDRATWEALKIAYVRITDYHERQKPTDDWYHDAQGVWLGLRWRAIASVGLYVPGGTALYPSSVLMNAVPARVAGVERIVMVTPPFQGEVDPLVLAAADLVGIDEIYQVGGAQAIGALCWGTRTMDPVAKIVGPGNRYVSAAKRQVFGRVGIDMIAGPSEILVVADSSAEPAWIAADLLSQAEHDTAAQAILISDDVRIADRVCDEVKRQLATLPRAHIAGPSWQDHGVVIIVDSLDVVPDIVDTIAPEHLQLAMRDSQNMAARIHYAGAIFLGHYTPEAIGDYIAGPNHVLPTCASARFSSVLGVHDFLVRHTVTGCDPQNLAKIGPPAALLAEAEGLQGHARSLNMRLDAYARSKTNDGKKLPEATKFSKGEQH